MSLETAFLVALACIAAAPLLAVLKPSKRSAAPTGGVIAALWLGLAGLIISTQFLWTDQPASAELKVTNRPIQRPTGGYAGSAACKSCHPHNHATWHDSYHRTMTQVASEQSVIGDFDNVRLSGKDLEVRLFKRGQQFLAEFKVSNPSFGGVYPVVLTTGSHTRQAYWLADESGEALAILPFMYFKAERMWMPRHSGYINPEFRQSRPELVTFKKNFGRWRRDCIKCHTTGGRVAPVPDRAEPPGRHTRVTQAVEFGISCEACHGPGGEHVRVNQSPLRRYGQHLAGGPDPTIVNPRRLPHDRSSQVCGQCHSVSILRDETADIRWATHGYSYRPGDDLTSDPLRFIMPGRPEQMPVNRPKDWPSPADVNSFWSDGMIRASGREYNGLIESPCFQRGQMSCLSCHEMHQGRSDPRARQDWADDQLKFGMDGNRACVQCHERFQETTWLTRHTHHSAGSAGSVCYNCHMPFTTYGLLKAIRSHQINSPSVGASLKTGRPNACNQCHQDKTLAWTADRLSHWYNIPKPKLSEDEQHIAATALWALRGDAGQRALMAWSFGWGEAHEASGNHWQAPYLAQLLEDSYDAVRFIAWRSLRRLPGFQGFQYDCLGPPEDRAAAHKRAVRVWGLSHKPAARPFAPSVLIDAHGRILSPEFERQWKQRDDRPMIIAE